MFEEDVPSVLELEMEELDQWMKKDSKQQKATLFLCEANLKTH